MLKQQPGGVNKVFLMLVAVCLVVAVGAYVTRPNSDDSGDRRSEDRSDGAEALSDSPTPSRAAERDKADKTDKTEQQSNPFDAAEGLSPLPGPEFPGFGGAGGSSSMKKVRVRLEVSSPVAIGTIGYQVPASLTDPSGIVRNVGTRWSLDTIAYGRPDYARLFFSAGPRGTPVSCVITVNGKVTERRSTSGPYGATMCQG